MSSDPDVNILVKFQDQDPNTQEQCIYFVKKPRLNRRCKNACSDNKRAVELHRIITQTEPDQTLPDIVQEYIQSSCCAEAEHRDIIMSSPLLIPSVERWMDEMMIERYPEVAPQWSAQSSISTTLELELRTGISAPSSCSTSTPYAGKAETSFFSESDSYVASSKASIASSIQCQLNLSSTRFPQSSTTTPSTTPSETEVSEAQKRHTHWPRDLDNAFARWSKNIKHSLSACFFPRKSKPTYKDTVAWRFREPLDARGNQRDFKEGAVYVYSREISPGYVKIGWTSRSVDERLSDWSNCGYTPIKLFETERIPHAQRIETLTHYQMIKEWRREKTCDGCRTRKGKQIRHQEWFEVDQEKAIQVLSAWVKLFTEADPYDTGGALRPEWRAIVDDMEQDGKAITAEGMFKRYKMTASQNKSAARQRLSVRNGLVAKKSQIGSIEVGLQRLSIS